MKTVIQGGAKFAFAILLLVNAACAQPTNLPALIQAAEQTSPLSPESVPAMGTFYSAQNPNTPPTPSDALGLPAWNLGNGLWLLDDLDVNYSSITPFGNSIRQPSMRMMAAMDSPPVPGIAGSGGSSSSYTPFVVPTNGLWLQITNFTTNLAYLNLNNATNQVYAIWSTTNLTNGSWQVETEVWPTNSVVMPFTVPTSGRSNLFMMAQDWTGVTENGNTTPDWWFFQYFGQSAFPNGHLGLSDGNLDAQGANTLLYDYQNGLDPDIIRFSYSVTNYYAASSTPTVQLSVSAGVASSVGFSLDDTNYVSHATWQPFSSPRVTANLGTNAGWHVLWIGLRGNATNATPSWQRVRFNLQPTPPQIVLTNPVTSIVAAPFIQVQGYSADPLASISYDVSNANGLITNLPGSVSKHYYDSNLLAYTTNFFQLYDVGLTNGSNLITVHARDMAGNVATTNFSFIVDYSGLTNPPAFTLYWPHNNEQVSGSTVTIRGSIDNPNAKVQATIVDAFGDTNLVAGVVGRNGLVWLDNVPLASGTNSVLLTATDPAGNVAKTNFNVIQSPLQLTITPVNSNSLYQSMISVSGSISDTADYTVWVNGVMAYQDGSGNWSASSVPLTRNSGRALAQARAIPNSDNGGQGTGGGGTPSDADLGNPDSAGSVTTTLSEARPAQLIVSSYNVSLDSPFEMHPREGWTVSQTYTYDALGTDSSIVSTIFIPPSNITTNIQNYPDPSTAPSPGPEHADYDTPIPQLISYPGSPMFEGTWPWQRNSDTMFSLMTGGDGSSGQQSLFAVNVTASIITDIYWPLEGLTSPPSYQASPGEIQADGMTPDTNYMVYLLAADGETNDFPVSVAGQQYVTMGASATKYTLTHETLWAAPGDANDARLNIGVGERVQFGGMTPNTTWTASGGVMDWTYGTDDFLTAPSQAGSVTVTATTGGVAQSVTFNVVAPSGVVATVISTNSDPFAEAFAGMQLNVVVKPTNVSFGALWMMEIGMDATNTSGYFTNHPAPGHTTQAGANQPHPVLPNNLIGDQMDHASGNFGEGPWSPGGSFTWPIPAVWWVGGTTNTNSLNWSSQTFTLGPDGTVTVQKFGHSVTRTIENQITTN